jgi:hypothetical protein
MELGDRLLGGGVAWWVLLLSLTIAGACVVEEQPVADAGTGGRGGTAGAGGTGGTGGDPIDPCGGCTLPTPVCDESNFTCVECLPDRPDACPDTAPICDAETLTCICETDADCKNPTAARCALETQQCVECDDDAQCDDVDGLPPQNNACNPEGVCVDCTPETEAETCPGGFSCDPRLVTCTETTVGSRAVCETCVADSECGDDGFVSDDFRCVPMFYLSPDIPFPDTGDGFCLQIFAPGGCSQPYAIRISDRRSLSDSTLRSYCGINENLATCPAVRALDLNRPCASGEDTDCPVGGLCRAVGGLANRCTYPCSDETQCDEPPNPGSTCDSSDTLDYCGG